MSPDKKSETMKWKAALISLAPILFFITALLILSRAFDLPVSEFDAWFENFRQSHFAIPIVVTTFIAGSFLGLPQWALFAGVIAVFGPIEGGFLSWGSTIISGSVNFFIGRCFGQKHLERGLIAKGRLAQFIKRLRENGFLASFAVRLVPTGPFILVNMLAGASGLNYAAFIGGTALGIIPKILIVALLAQGVLGEENRLGATLLFMGAACFVAILVWILKRRLSFRTDKASIDEI